MAQLDDLMRLFGGLALAFAAVVLGVYLGAATACLSCVSPVATMSS